MGLQTWPPSTAPLHPPMACLDVETPTICGGKFKSVLQLCLQQRRTREQLVEQGIMPPLKTPAAFHQQIRSLERARTGNFLKHKLCSRPQRSELVRMHILQETQAEPSLQAAQMKLKRARLAQDLKGKLAQRPGAMELLEKNILPVLDDNGLTQLNHGENPETPDVHSMEEDSSEALSPAERPSSRESEASPRESAAPQGPPASSSPPQLPPPPPSSPPDSARTPPAPAPTTTTTTTTNNNNNSAPATTGPLLVKQSQARPQAEKARGGKKSREAKPRVRKLKYHQYVPAEQRSEASEAPCMDSAYARLLQQQQQFLQLQILSQQQQQQQQQQQLTYQPLTHTNTHSRAPTEAPTSCSNTPPRHTHTQTQTPGDCRRRQQLPANLDEMKVAELKAELKLRSLPVSGTKTDLIERLRAYHEASGPAVAMETKPEHAKLMPPLSPVTSKVSSMDIEDSGAGEGQAVGAAEGGGAAAAAAAATETTEKDKRLHEKERQIEELKRKLEQEQRLVEELKLQLEVEKRSQLGEEPQPPPPPPRIDHSPPPPPPPPPLIKEEVPPSCLGSSPRQPLKQEEERQSPAHFVLGHQSVQGATSRQPMLKPTFAKCRDPPRYEDAVKQTRLMTAAQGWSAVSQQMDDLFAVLIESGEISPFIKAEPPGAEKPLPVTASVTTLPINTALSRPPALVQVARPPDLGLASDPEAEAQALKLMAAMEVEFGEEEAAAALGGVEAMDWLELTLGAPAEGSVFTFLDSQQLQLNWD